MVIDSSVFINFTVLGDEVKKDIEPYFGNELFAPGLFYSETVHYFNKLARNKYLAETKYELIIKRVKLLQINEIKSVDLIIEASKMRHNITAYDAMYVALAKYLEQPLLTCDHRLAKAAKQYCDVIAIDVNKK